jgi:hypothetical protein
MHRHCVRPWEPLATNQFDSGFFSPPEGPAEQFYQNYIVADLENPEFRRTYLEGLRTDRVFSDKFIAPESNYGKFNGEQVIEGLVADPESLTADLTDLSMDLVPHEVDRPQSRRETLKLELTTASICVTQRNGCR